jgi:hypothetical protein
MMEDRKVARIFTSAIIGEDVLELEFCPQEFTMKSESLEVSDRIAGKRLNRRSPFIDELHHKSGIIQISNLKTRRRSELKVLLGIFDQSDIADSNHAINVKEEDFPEEYRHIIRRLKKADETKEIEEQMTVDDEFVHTFRLLERQKEIALEKKDREIEEKVKEIEEKDKLIEELQRRSREKNSN